MEAALIFSLIYILSGLWFLFLTIYALFPGNHVSTVGTLTKRVTRKNVRSKHGYLIPNVTNYTYSYTVNGRTYRLKQTGHHTKSCLTRKVTIVYLRGFPRCAAIDRYNGSLNAFFAILLLAGGAWFLYLCLSAA